MTDLHRNIKNLMSLLIITFQQIGLNKSSYTTAMVIWKPYRIFYTNYSSSETLYEKVVNSHRFVILEVVHIEYWICCMKTVEKVWIDIKTHWDCLVRNNWCNKIFTTIPTRNYAWYSSPWYILYLRNHNRVVHRTALREMCSSTLFRLSLYW